MTIETNNIVNNLAPAWLQDILNVKKNLNIYSYIIIFWKFHVWKLHIVVRIVLSLLLLHWGTVFCTISGLKIVSPNSRVLCNPVMCQKVSIPHVGTAIASFYSIFEFKVLLYFTWFVLVCLMCFAYVRYNKICYVEHNISFLIGSCQRRNNMLDGRLA